MNLEATGDPVFASRALGEGVGVVPETTGETAVLAPVSGMLKTVARTGHAFGIKTDGGIEVLVHIGIDTVDMDGEEESSIYARQRDGRFGMIFHRTWGAPYDPHAFLSSMRVPSHADFQAQQGLADKPLIDKEIGEVLATHDETQRQALYRDILTRLHDEAVYLPISYISMMVVSKPELGNIPYAPIATEIPFEQIKPVKP